MLLGGENLEAKLLEIAQKLPPKKLRVGFLEGTMAGHDGKQKPAAEVAFWNEYGTIGRQTLDTFKPGGDRASGPQHVPARPFFRTMIISNSSGWGGILARYLKAQGYNVEAALGGLGLAMKEQLERSIKDFNSPANAPSTKDKKGHDKPLEDSRNMLRAVDFDIQEGVS
jgi:hypothetical protein